MSKISFPVKAIDAVVNIQTEEALKYRPKDRQNFYLNKIGVDEKSFNGLTLHEMLHQMDAAGIEKAFDKNKFNNPKGGNKNKRHITHQCV